MSKNETKWELFAHDADIGVRGYGHTKDEAFEQAGLALTAVIVADPARVRAEQPVSVHCEAPDIELLFADWLNALIYEMAVRRMLFGRFAVRIVDDRRLDATAWGEVCEPARHEPAVEVKGATFTALRVAPVETGWMAQTVVDV